MPDDRRLTLTTKPQERLGRKTFSYHKLAAHASRAPERALHILLVDSGTIIDDPNRPRTGTDPAVDMGSLRVDGVVHEFFEDRGVGREGDGGLDESRVVVWEADDGQHGDQEAGLL